MSRTFTLRRRPGSITTIVALLVAISAARLVLNQPGLGLSFLMVLPIVLAAERFGRRGALVTAAASLTLFLVDEAIAASDELSGATLAYAAVSRAAVFFGVGLLAARLFGQRTRLREDVESRDHELLELRSLRQALTPPVPRARPRLDVATLHVPAESGVAGDFFLIVPGVGDVTLVAIGDVVGHGLGPARQAMFIRACLASFVMHSDDPAQLLELTNAAMLERAGASEAFATVACATVDPNAGRLAYALAGHPVPWWLDTGLPLPSGGGLPLGVDARVGAPTHEAELPLGAGMLLYSDGLSEARSMRTQSSPAGGGLLGMDAVAEEVRRTAGRPSRAVILALRDVVAAHAGPALADDLCHVALRATA